VCRGAGDHPDPKKYMGRLQNKMMKAIGEEPLKDCVILNRPFRRPVSRRESPGSLLELAECLQTGAPPVAQPVIILDEERGFPLGAELRGFLQRDGGYHVNLIHLRTSRTGLPPYYQINDQKGTEITGILKRS